MKKQLTTFLILFGALGTLFSQAIPEVLYYRFDSTGTSVRNEASAPPVGTTYGTIMGSVTQGDTGQCRGALIGSGNSASSDDMNTGYATNLPGDWTISMWTKDITPSSTLFYIFGDPSAGSFRCFTNGVAGANNWILRGPITDVLVSGGATVAPHVTTFVYDGTAGNIYAYLDGVLVNTVAETAFSLSGTGPFQVMGYSSNIGAPAGGKLDEFRVYNRALSATEVAQLANAPSVYSTLNISACNSYTVPSGNSTYTTSGTYMDTIPSLSCGDSIMTIHLTIANSSSAFSVSNCTGYTVPSGNATYTTSGTYMDTIPNAAGCDSIMTINVTIYGLPVVTAAAADSSVCVDDPAVALTGTPSGGIWSGPGVTGNTFDPATAGTGTHTVTYFYTDGNSCSDSASVTITVNACTGIHAQALLTGVGMYPNPNNGVFTLSVNSPVNDMKIEVTDLEGRVIYSSAEGNTAAGFSRQINLRNEPAGMYLLKVTGTNGQYTGKISVLK